MGMHFVPARSGDPNLPYLGWPKLPTQLKSYLRVDICDLDVPQPAWKFTLNRWTDNLV